MSGPYRIDTHQHIGAATRQRSPPAGGLDHGLAAAYASRRDRMGRVLTGTGCTPVWTALSCGQGSTCFLT